jgi:hypothetical protein
MQFFQFKKLCAALENFEIAFFSYANIKKVPNRGNRQKAMSKCGEVMFTHSALFSTAPCRKGPQSAVEDRFDATSKSILKKAAQAFR